MNKQCVDIDEVLDLFGISDRDIYAKETIEDALYDGTLKIYDPQSAERHGRWIEEYSENHFQAKCSACGKSTLYGITYDLEGNAYYMNYCPNCGADMRGEQDE